MIIDIEELKTFIECPMKYKIRYKLLPTETKLYDAIKKFDLTLHEVIYSFFTSIQCNKIITIQESLRIFGTRWIQKFKQEEIIFKTNKTKYDVERIKAHTQLVNFYNSFKSDPGVPIAVNEPWKIKIGEDTLTGRFDLIRNIKNKQGEDELQLIDFKTFYNFEKYSNRDLEITANGLAFKTKFKIEPDKTFIYNFTNNKFIEAERNNFDYKMLINSIKSFKLIDKNNTYYTVPTDKCTKCLYRGFCMYGSSINDLVGRANNEDVNIEELGDVKDA
jgi:hypothetical protein